MAIKKMALVNKDGSLIAIQNVNPEKAELIEWPRYVDIVEFMEKPSPYHKIKSVNGRLVDNQWVVTAEWTDPDLNQVKLDLLNRIDEKAEQVRSRYITLGSGQALAYQAKADEVKQWIAAGKPTDASAQDYPWAASRAAQFNVNVNNVLAEWEARSAAWAQAGILIESRRESGKEAVSVAMSAVNAYAAFENIDWSLS